MAAARKGGTRKPARRSGFRLRWPGFLQGPGARRWLLAAGLALAFLLLLPIVHGFGGEVGVIVVGSFALGFLFGRGTAA